MFQSVLNSDQLQICSHVILLRFVEGNYFRCSVFFSGRILDMMFVQKHPQKPFRGVRNSKCF